MKLYVELILSVSLTGTIPLCVYLLLKRPLETKISASLQYRIMKLLLFCFLIPFALLKSLLVSAITPTPGYVFDEYVYLSNTIVKGSDGYQLIPRGGFYELILPLLCVSSVVFLSYQLYRYLRFRHNILKYLKADTLHQQQLASQKEQLGLKRKVSLYYCDAPVSPFTYGIFNPCVILTSVVPEGAVSMTIRHELQHIKSHDFLFRTIACLVVFLHCWNPFIYLLWKEFRDAQEMTCDEKVTASFCPYEVRLYGYAILDIAASVQRKFSFSTPFAGNNKKELHRRVINLRTRFQKRSLFASIFLLVLCLIGFGVPVMACAPNILCFETRSTEELTSIDWTYIELKDENAPLYPEDELHFQYVDQYLLLEDGTVVDLPADKYATPKEKAACSHSWQPGILKDHIDDGKGGCDVFVYNATICTKCHAVKNQTYLYSTNYGICPHK